MTKSVEAMNWMIVIGGYGACVVLGLLCAIFLWKIWKDEINLTTILSEANGQASMSRLQLLIFTIVIAFSLFILVERLNKFPDMPEGILTLLGISASTYAVGKGISYSREEGVTTPEERENARQTSKAMSDTGAKNTVTTAKAESDGAKDAGHPGGQDGSPKTDDNAG